VHRWNGEDALSAAQSEKKAGEEKFEKVKRRKNNFRSNYSTGRDNLIQAN